VKNTIYQIDDACHLIKGKYPTLKTPPGEYPFVVTATFRRNASTYQIDGKAVCIPLISSTGHGHAALHRIHYEEGKFAVANLLVALVVKNENNCFPKYLYYLLNTKKDEYFVPLMKGSANVSLNLKDIARVKISLPPLSEQRRIVARIDELAAKVEETKKLRGNSENEIQFVIEYFLKNIISKNQHNKSWTFETINKFVEINPSRRNKLNLQTNDKVTFVPMSAVDAEIGTISQPQIRNYFEVAKGFTWFTEGDVIFARITPCMENGKAALANNLVNQTGFGSTEFHVLRPGSQISGKWLHCIVRQKDFREDAANHFKGTAGQQRVPESFFFQKQIAVPPLDEQQQIIKYLDNLQLKINSLKKLQAETEKELNALLPSILDKAFKGEL
jgi:type I restriction enzyme S subunit